MYYQCSKFMWFAAATSLAVALSGCGGGSSSISKKCTINGESRPFSECEGLGGGGANRPPEARVRHGGIPAAARNMPRAGASVTQSSIGANGVTSDNISVEVSYAGNGRVNYRVANGTQWSLGSNDLDTQKIANRQIKRESSGLTLTGVLAFEGQGRRTGSVDANVTDGVGVQFLTDIDGATDSDYMVWGSWGVAPGGNFTHQDTIQGAFATGNDPFRQATLAGVTNTATYRGDVDGRYFDSNALTGGNSFAASATLEANFGDGSALGTISGRIDKFFFRTSGGFVSRPVTVVNLGRTAIGGADNGFFKGGSTGTYADGTLLSGQWGGRFFGNGDGNSAPGSVAGTFGATNAGGSRGLIGAFGAHR